MTAMLEGFWHDVRYAFRVLGVRPWRGRLLMAQDELPNCPSTNAVVSYRYWQVHMGGRELSDTSRLFVDGERVQVVGVTPPEFLGIAVGETFDVARPFCQPKELRRDNFEITVIGRMRPGWTIERTSANLDALIPRRAESVSCASNIILRCG